MADTNQDLRHEAITTALTMTPGANSQDWLRMFDAAGFTTGTFNERLLRWINGKLSTSFTNINDAQAAYALSIGGYNNWNTLATVTV